MSKRWSLYSDEFENSFHTLQLSTLRSVDLVERQQTCLNCMEQTTVEIQELIRSMVKAYEDCRRSKEMAGGNVMQQQLIYSAGSLKGTVDLLTVLLSQLSNAQNA